MTELIISILFSLWFLITLIYSFKAKILGNLGRWLHGYGWLKEWSMYTHLDQLNTGFNIYFKDLKYKEEITEWKLLELNGTSAFFPILNVQVRIQFFLNKCLKKLKHFENKSGSINIRFSPFFNFLCAVVGQMTTETETRYRKIKVERILPEGDKMVSVESDLIEIK